MFGRFMPTEGKFFEIFNAHAKHIVARTGLLSFSRHGNESVEVECIPKHGDGHVDNVA